MSRPWNETEEDLAMEAAAKAKITELWSCKILKLQPGVYNGIDWSLHRSDGKLRAWAEFKCRREDNATRTTPQAMHKYRTLKISYGKWLHLRWYSERSGVPHIIFIQWAEGLFYAQWVPTSGLGYATGIIANRRGQEGDEEPSIDINITEFKPVVKPEAKRK